MAVADQIILLHGFRDAKEGHIIFSIDASLATYLEIKRTSDTQGH
jgi:hypothetical protein